MHNPYGTLLVTAIVVAAPILPASAQNRCDAGKLKCVRTKAACLLKVHEASQKKGLPLDAAKLQKCMDKFDGASDPSTGCFAKLEAKPEATCSTTENAAAVEAQVDQDVQALVAALNLTAGPNRCDAGKVKCIRTKLACLLKVHKTAQKKGLPLDTAKLEKCMGKFDGGADPAKGCFAKLEAKQDATKPDTQCSKTGDAAGVEADVDGYVDALLALLSVTPPSTTTTSTTVSTTTSTIVFGFPCRDAGGGTCSGDCPLGYPCIRVLGQCVCYNPLCASDECGFECPGGCTTGVQCNGHECVKRQLARAGVGFEALDNGLLACADSPAPIRAARPARARVLPAVLHEQELDLLPERNRLVRDAAAALLPSPADHLSDGVEAVVRGQHLIGEEVPADAESDAREAPAGEQEADLRQQEKTAAAA